MKHVHKIVAIGGLATVLLSTAAWANNSIQSVKELNNKAHVEIIGTVDKVKNEREFTLRDKTGTIDVDIESNQSVILKEGAEVTVKGNVDKGITGTDINATSVSVSKNLPQAIGDTIERSKTVSLEGAASYNIKNLPDQGLVKISGVVDSVSNEKEFVVRDHTGTIDIDIESPELAAIAKGSEVTVIGYVDKGIMGKDINATKVLVNESAQPVANQRNR